MAQAKETSGLSLRISALPAALSLFELRSVKSDAYSHNPCPAGGTASHYGVVLELLSPLEFAA